MSRIFALFLALLVSSAVMAEELPADPPEQIGRIAAISGAVAYAAAADATPSDATVNLPLSTGNRVAVPPRAHAAVDIAAGRFYLDGGSTMTIGALKPGFSTVTLEQGALILHILPGGAGQVFVIATPRGALRADQPGYFEVEVSEGRVFASAVEGGAQFEATVLPPGTRATISEGQGPVLDAAVADDFVRRIAAEIAEAGDNDLKAPKYVSPQATGFQELERNGLWVMTEEYGPVWEPQVMSDWAPFHKGRWVAIAPWGRTWIDDAPWGFAPAHYGRWTQVNHRWVWIPGNAAIAPATASLFGTEPESSKSAGGWVPLGPEVPVFTPAPVIVNTVRVTKQPEPPKVVNVTTVNTTTNVTTVVRPDSRPAVVLFNPPVLVPPPSPPPSVSMPSSNVTGLGASGTPIGGGVRFPGQ